jgi:hypothetical protein
MDYNHSNFLPPVPHTQTSHHLLALITTRQAQQPHALSLEKPHDMIVVATITRTKPVQASARQVHSHHGHKIRAIKLQYVEKIAIERDDKLRRLVQERMKDLEKGTGEIGTFGLKRLCHHYHQLTMNLKRQPTSRNIQIVPRSNQRPLRSRATSCEYPLPFSTLSTSFSRDFSLSNHLCTTSNHSLITNHCFPQALKRYNIHDDWRQYALYIVHGDQERCLGLKEKPLLLFKQLDKEGRKPMFMLRRHASPQDGWSGAAGGGGGGNSGLDTASVSGSTIGGGKTVPGGVL